MPYSHVHNAQTWITVLAANDITPACPDCAIPNWGSRHPIGAYYSFVDPERM